jgi:lysylphosphatidylglycerol synthetase-like protein (DUF2156 family)
LLLPLFVPLPFETEVVVINILSSSFLLFNVNGTDDDVVVVNNKDVVIDLLIAVLSMEDFNIFDVDVVVVDVEVFVVVVVLDV